MKILLTLTIRRLLVISFIMVLSGCTKPMFYWGDYEDSLYERYVENNSQEAYVKLNRTILEGESQKQRIAPGIYADYGFVLFQRGDAAGAVQHFQKEKQLYPESAALMDKLISKIQEKQKSTKLTVDSQTDHTGASK